jgi:hypothetical protein
MEYGRRLRGTILADRLRSTLSDDDGAINLYSPKNIQIIRGF